MGYDLLFFASLLTAACLQDVPNQGSGHLPVDVSMLSGDHAPETGTEEVEVAARCRLQPLDQEMAVDAGSSAPPVAGPGLLLVPEGVAVGAVVALVEAPAPGVECRLVGGGFRLRRTAGRMFTVVTTAALDRERRDEYRLRLVTGSGSDGGESPFTVRVTDVNDNSPVFTAPRPPWVSVPMSPAAESGCPTARTHLLPVTAVKAADADSGANGELVYELAAAEGEVGGGGGVFGMGIGGELRANVCRLSGLPGREWRLRVRVWDGGSPRRSASTVLTVSFVPAATGSLAPAAVTGLALAAVCAALLPVVLLLRSACGDRWRRRRDGGAYNCRRAETDYRPQPRRPERLIHKTDIALLPTSRRAEPSTDPLPLPAAGLSGTEPLTPSPGRQRHRHRQLLRELVRLSRAGCPDGSLDLAAGSPHVQISQLLSLLHQGQFQARPNFRGNKYLKTCRGTGAEADQPTRKDSGQGESEGGDSDSDVGSTPPLHELLNEGLNGLLARGSWETSPGQGGGAGRGERLSLEDLFWALPSSLPSDYKENVFSLESETVPETADGERTTFSTFGKGVPEHGAAFLTEMAVLFHQLLGQSPQPGSHLEPYLPGHDSERSSDGRLPSLHESPEQRAGSESPTQ
ncbi:protocadherin-18-like isoform X2 [Amblyraja radiata]|uniref:protocadherin-18-like isoform X2 n=1 Tax=Amblyraja radiata TaxID=386614 RepID=UPI00140375CE|nr:protocadherin-18-like isoform X2 [Amblyraja radiata]